MVFFFGVLSVLQIVFFPGFFFVSFLKNKNVFEKIILIFFFSLIINYLIVTTLIFLNIYSKNSLVIILLFELLFFLFIFKKNTFLILNFKNYLQLFFFIFLLLVIIFAFYKNFGNVIFEWDGLVSFNEWAKKLAHSEYPTSMVRPLFLPKIWSISYVLIDDVHIDYFVKFLTSFYPSIILIIAFSDIYQNNKLRSYTLFIFSLFFFYCIKNFLLLAYTDIPLFLFGFFIFYMCLNRDNFSYPLVLTILFFGCLIKLSAIFYYPFVLLKYAKIRKNNEDFIFIVIFFIYLINLYSKNIMNLDFKFFNEMSQLNNFNILSKINSSFHILKQKNLLFILILSLLISIFNKKTFQIFIFSVIPGLLYWGFLLSYDFRNVLPVFVSSIYIISIGIDRFFDKNYFHFIINHLRFNYIIKVNGLYFIMAIIFILSCSLTVKTENLIKINTQAKVNQIGDRKIIKPLQDIFLSEDFSYSEFKTNYQLLFFMPLFSSKLNYQNNYSELNAPEGKTIFIYSDTIENNLKKNNLFVQNYILLKKFGEFSIYSLKN
jgi:hypothetical protein